MGAVAAAELGYVSPPLGEPAARWRQVRLLSEGGMFGFGAWTNDGRYLGWTRLPRRDQVKDGAIAATPNQRR